MSTRLGGTPRHHHHPNRWRRRMAELLEAIAAAEVEGDRGGMWDEYEVCRQNAEMVDAEAEMALRLTAEAVDEMARLAAEAESS